MKISENNFIQGAIDIIALSLERARRTGAVTNYEQSRVALHNSIVLLEMLTNVKSYNRQVKLIMNIVQFLASFFYRIRYLVIVGEASLLQH